MKKLTTLILLLLSPLVVAQEKQVWACQQVEGTGLFWESGSWKQYLMNPIPVLFTIDGPDSIYKEGDKQHRFACSASSLGRISCVSRPDGLRYVLLDPATSKMGATYLSGAIRDGDVRDSLSVYTYNCTKF